MNYLRLLSISIIIFFSTLFIVDNVNAQSMDFGISGGINISSHLNNFRYTSGDIELDLDPQITLGYQGGFIARKNLSRSWRFQAEPSLILLGAKYEEPFMLRDFELQTESKTELIYIQLPLLLQLTTSPPRQKVYGRQQAITTYHLTGGIFGGYLLDAQFSGTNTGAPVGVPFEGDFSNDITSQHADFDGGIIIGAGFEYGENSKIGLETRAMISVIDSGNDPLLPFDPRNIAVTLSAYFLF